MLSSETGARRSRRAMTEHVTDPRSNAPDQIANAAKVIGRSKHKRDVFRFIYRNQKQRKSVTEIAKALRLPRTRALDAGKALADNGLVTSEKSGRETFYGKDKFYRQHRKTILRLAGNRKKLDKYPTKTNPRVAIGSARIVLPKAFFARPQLLTVDAIDSFSKVRRVSPASVQEQKMKEVKFKGGIKKILGEKGKFKDWGGETNDLWAAIRVKGQRVPTVFAFKGPGQKGKLVPRMMGKNGDQIQRLFSSTVADAYVVQYWSQIDESILEQMKFLATARSTIERRRIYYGVIDGTDSARLIRAYPKAFK